MHLYPNFFCLIMLIPIKIVIIIFIVLGCNNLDELTYVVVILDMGEDNKP